MIKKTLQALLLCLSFSAFSQSYVVAVHGGAGFINEERFTQEEQDAYKAKLSEALLAAKVVLDSGGSAVDAVEQAIIILENSPLFNAGKGAVMTYDENCEMDASIMSGSGLNAGAVAGVTRVKNPISGARKVMENSKHVMLSGDGANDFCKTQKLEMVAPKYFETAKSQKSIDRYKKKTSATWGSQWEDSKMGTVGCVALDRDGNLAAGTSTGGMTGKRYGRIGDSPIIGAGTYANNRSCAVSCTGHGEFFIRHGVAFDMHARMLYGLQSLEHATYQILHERLAAVKALGGLIAIDKSGNVVMDFNTQGMFRGYVREMEEPRVFLFAK